MRLGDENQHVTVSASRETYVDDGQRDYGGDVFVDVDVRVGNLSGSVGVIVARTDWQTFLTSLSEVEKTRRGEALLRSADERELSLRVYARDPAGHMAVAGQIRDLLTHAQLTFDEVHFDSTLLPGLVIELSAVPKADQRTTGDNSGEV